MSEQTNDLEPRYCRGCDEWIAPDRFVDWEGLTEPTYHEAGKPEHPRCGPLFAAVLTDRYVVSETTGEILAIVTPAAPDGHPFVVWDRASAEWVLERLSEAELEVDAIRRRREILLENLEAMERPLVRRVEWLRARFGEGLEKWAREELEGSKTRTIRTPFGSISFRKRRERLLVTDEETALAWAEEHRPEAIRTTRKILVSEIPRDALGWKADPLPAGFAIEPAGETCSIKTGVDDERR